jgi:predicted anti-sigma-YlaC factor YlaD
MTGMDCARAEELLSDDWEGTLDPLFRRDLQDHLSACPHCRALRAAMQEVVEDLRSVPELAPPAGLADRVAEAVARAGKGPRRRSWSFRFQAAAAVVAIAGTSILYTTRGPALREGTRLVERVGNARVYLTERKDRLVEDVRILRVLVGAAFEGRLDRVNDRVEDYRRLLERRKSAEQKRSEAPAKGPTPEAGDPGANFRRTGGSSIS